MDMKTLNPYIDFGGRCRQAMTFYKNAFGGEITVLQTFAEAGMDVPEPFKNNVIHSELKAEGILFQASDGQPGVSPVPVGDNINFNVNLTDESEEARLFAALAEGGRVDQPLGITFWNSIYGAVTDRYGIHWIFNCPKS
jgi:PhnB protein